MAEGRWLIDVYREARQALARSDEFVYLICHRGPASLMRGFDVGARVRRVVAHLLGECPVARVVAGL